MGYLHILVVASWSRIRTTDLVFASPAATLPHAMVDILISSTFWSIYVNIFVSCRVLSQCITGDAG
jgi:hypothetical protein